MQNHIIEEAKLEGKYSPWINFYKFKIFVFKYVILIHFYTKNNKQSFEIKYSWLQMLLCFH
jgi:ABC-type transport system involved in cytochrome c biogenesis permease subunit